MLQSINDTLPVAGLINPLFHHVLPHRQLILQLLDLVSQLLIFFLALHLQQILALTLVLQSLIFYQQ